MTAGVDGAQVAQALDGYAAGLDFADALHLAGSAEAPELVTFDRNFAKRGRDLDVSPPVRLLE